jgi:hypothetical protein
LRRRRAELAQPLPANNLLLDALLMDCDRLPANVVGALNRFCSAHFFVPPSIDFPEKCCRFDPLASV